MNTFITILLFIVIMIICYYINKRIFKLHLKGGDKYNWTSVNTNLIMSIFIFPSVIYWILVILYNLPKFPDDPPRWM